ncbi:MAG: hypothetical protein WDM81_00735 [Rhizomicrobium sp.]
MVRSETEEILDLSARTLSTIHARTVPRAMLRKPVEPVVPEQPESEGLLGMAKRLTQRRASRNPTRRPRTPSPARAGKCARCSPPSKRTSSAI